MADTPEYAATPDPFDVAVSELAARLRELGASPQEATQAAVEVAAQAQPKAKPRTVSSPVYTLGGRKMDTGRPMTPQEQRMVEDPAAQMGIDAGAALSRGVNSAGFGLPGLIMENVAPNALAGIRENEANANPVARGVGDIVGGLSAPVGTVGRGLAGGGKAALEAFNAMPTAGKYGTAFGAAAALPSEAATPENTKPNDFTPPSLWQEAIATVKNALMGQEPGSDQPLTLDEFKQSRRTIQPKTYEAILAEEKDKVKTDPTYTYGPRQRAALEQKAEKNAQLRATASQGDLDKQEARLGSEYDAYRDGWQKQRDEYYNRQFSERNPKAAMAMTIGGPLLSAAATKGIFSKIDKAGADIAAAANTARTSDDMIGMAENLIKADKYRVAAPVGKALTVAEATALPAELRMMQDVIDKKGLPPTAGARKAAEERMADIPSYAAGMGWDLVSGLIGTGTGALMNKRFGESPAASLAVTRAYGRGVDTKGLAPDEIAAQLSQRFQANKLAGGTSMSTPQGSGASPSPQPGPLPQVPGVVVDANALAGPQSSLSGPLGARGRYPDQPLGSEALSNRPPSEILGAIQRPPREVPTTFPQSTPVANPAPAAPRPKDWPEWASEPPPGIVLKKGQYWHDGSQRVHLANGDFAETPKYKASRPKAEKPQSQPEAPISKPSVQIDDMAPMGRRRPNYED